MYLKKLHLQGFKTFASKTEFLYDSGVTAIVGPNGSGKSNIADAIRWVLGEQRYSAIRGKKTEDVIFAGSSSKAAMGFAEASITFDNSDRLLPLDFNEITITRRAYRTGENEYFINKSKVRLKDVAEAVSRLSQTYTIITQGMVDAALSQKPEERRGLFEDAAAISYYNLKKNEAQERLNKTKTNTDRVADLLTEITPRLKGLEKSAKQAEEYYGIQEELQTLLKRWHGHRWRLTNRTLATAQQSAQVAQGQFDTGKIELEALQTQTAQVRHRLAEQRGQLGELHRLSSSQHSRAQQLQSQIAVDQERLDEANRQHEQQASELVNLEVQGESANRRAAELTAEYRTIQQEQANEQSHVAAQQTALSQKSAASRQAEQTLARQRETITSFNNKLESLKNRANQVTARRAELARQSEQYFQTRETLLTKQSGLQDEQATAAAGVTALEQQVRVLAEGKQVIESQRTAAQEKLRQSESQVQNLRSSRDAANSRLDLLKRLAANFAGVSGGVKTVLQAADGANPKLSGVLGLVANLVEVPAEYELAIETALGGHLQDVVVRSWPDAEAAISLLKSSGSGRATFLPLDTLRSSRDNRPVPHSSGVRGVASELVSYEPQYRQVYEQLLGRTLVVDNLQVARAVLPKLSGGWNVVTTGGEIVRSSGAVTGGAVGKGQTQDSGSVLVRERELRELPKQIAAYEDQIRATATQIAEQHKLIADLQQKSGEREREQNALNRTLQNARETVTNLRSQADRLTDELRLREESHANLTRETVGLDQQDATIVADRQKINADLETAKAKLAELEKALKAAQVAEQAERDKLTTLRTATMLAEQRLKNSAANLQFAQNEVKRLQEQTNLRQAQLTALETRRANLHSQLAAAQKELTSLAAELEDLRTQIGPLEQTVQQLEISQRQHEEQWTSASSQLLQLEAAHSRAALEVQRVQGELENIQVQAVADLAAGEAEGEVNPDDWQELLELSGEEAQDLHRRVEQNRQKLRRIGIVNPLAMQEYREAYNRHSFLSGQLADLEQATQSLRQLIRELDQLTQEKFAETFEKVAEKFSKYFALLFNGGTARLTLTDPDNIAGTGIEIIAQPPGKRQQNLALLSGGERALTAVALLFALLEVNPTPFCVLDEVDAALDEANVGRFCQTLRSLSDKTQFIVITHNRGTIEAARTIYGISMGSDSVSKVISLRVDEVAKFREKVATRLEAVSIVGV